MAFATRVWTSIAVLLVLCQAKPSKQQLSCPDCKWSNSAEHGADSGAIAAVLYTNCNNTLTDAAVAVATAAVSGDVDSVAVQIAVGLANPDPQTALAELYAASLSLAVTEGQGSAMGAALATVATEIAALNIQSVDLLQLFWDTLDQMASSTPAPPCSFFWDAASAFVTSISKADPTLAEQTVAGASAPDLSRLCPDLAKRLNDKNYRQQALAVYKVWKGAGKSLSTCGRHKAAAAAVAVSLTLVTNPTCSVGPTTTPQAAAVAVAVAAQRDGCNFASALALTCGDNLNTTASAVRIAIAAATPDLGTVLATAAAARTCGAKAFFRVVIQQLSAAAPAITCATATSIASEFCAQTTSEAANGADPQLLAAAKGACSTPVC